MDDLREELADIRTTIAAMVGPSDYRLPLDRFQPSEHERAILLRLAELADVVDRLAAKIEARD